MFATVLASEEGFSGNSSLKKSSHNKIFEDIKRKFDKSLKNRQVKEKVELELGNMKFKRCLRFDARPRKKIRIYPDALNCFI